MQGVVARADLVIDARASRRIRVGHGNLERKAPKVGRHARRRDHRRPERDADERDIGGRCPVVHGQRREGLALRWRGGFGVAPKPARPRFIWPFGHAADRRGRPFAEDHAGRVLRDEKPRPRIGGEIRAPGEVGGVGDDRRVEKGPLRAHHLRGHPAVDARFQGAEQVVGRQLLRVAARSEVGVDRVVHDHNILLELLLLRRVRHTGDQRHGHRGQNPDNRNDHQDFHQRETSSRSGRGAHRKVKVTMESLALPGQRHKPVRADPG